MRIAHEHIAMPLLPRVVRSTPFQQTCSARYPQVQRRFEGGKSCKDRNKVEGRTVLFETSFALLHVPFICIVVCCKFTFCSICWNEVAHLTPRCQDLAVRSHPLKVQPYRHLDQLQFETPSLLRGIIDHATSHNPRQRVAWLYGTCPRPSLFFCFN